MSGIISIRNFYFYSKQKNVRVSGALLSIAMFYVLIDKYKFVGAAWGQSMSFLLLSIIGLVVFFITKNKK